MTDRDLRMENMEKRQTQTEIAIERITTLLEGMARWEDERDFLAENKQNIQDIPGLRKSVHRNSMILGGATMLMVMITGGLITGFFQGWFL